MPASSSKLCAGALGVAMLIAGLNTPALADSSAFIRVFARPIMPPPIVISSEYDGTATGLASNRVTLAAGGSLVSDYDGSNHYNLAPVAAVEARLHCRVISWHGTSLGIDLIPEHREQRLKFIFQSFVDANLDRTGRASDPVARLLPKVKVAAEGGVAIGFSKSGILVPSADRLTIVVSASHDLGSVHHSFEVSPSASYVMPLSKAALVSASASMDVVGAGYARTYFGVDRAASAASGLPAYSPGGGIKSVSFGLGSLVSLRGDLRKGFAVGALLNYEKLVGDVARSPLVAMRGSANQFSGALGVVYTF